MKPVLTSQQIREADAYTIQHEPVSSLELMERASKAFVKKFTSLAGRGKNILVLCGTGNNGGDGLAISRFLREQGFDVTPFVVGDPQKGSDDFTMNLERLSAIMEVKRIESTSDFPHTGQQSVIIDALFGSGLTRPLKGIYKSIVQHLNESGSEIYAVDIASGLYADQPTYSEAIIIPAHTISFQTPKPVFFMPSLSKFVGEWHIVDIGLDQKFVGSLPTKHFYAEHSDFPLLLPVRSAFMHKGEAGKVHIVAGSKGKMGAAVLCARAAIRSGAGLVFVQSPDCGRDILQMAVPEAMVIDDKGSAYIMGSDSDHAPVNAMAIGPGIGTNPSTVDALEELLSAAACPLVIDADAINIISAHPGLVKKLPKGSILTPHPGEFERLAGRWGDDYEKLSLLSQFCEEHQVHMVLKGAYSAVCNNKGAVYFNCSGNPGMATGGSGDVLTGIVVALTGQGLKAFDALRLGVYLHGLAGDIAVESVGQHSLTASDIIHFLPEAFKRISS